MNKISQVLFLLGFTLIAANVPALSTDQDKAIEIEADSASLDNQQGLTMYLGNVVIKQGSMQLKAEKVTLTYDDKREIEMVIAESVNDKSPAVQFEQTLDTKERVKAEARLMEYHKQKNLLHLKKSAKIWKNKDKITGEHIMYDARKGKITASSTKSGRIKVTIEPPK